MRELVVVSDFDGTITQKDGLYTFIEEFAKDGWKKIELDWINGKISSKECLIEEFKLVPDLSEELITSFVKSIGIDNTFKNFYTSITKQNVDFCIVSDGIDYFINKILNFNGLNNIKIYSNHGFFRGEFFEITFPNDNSECKNNAGTCKCKILNDLKKEYKKVVYIGDGVSDFCIAHRADVLYAKNQLAEYCIKNKIKYLPYNTFNDVKIL